MKTKALPIIYLVMGIIVLISCNNLVEVKQFRPGEWWDDTDGNPGQFIFLADRWKKTDLPDSRYIWLPLTFRNDSARIEWNDSWSLRK